MAIEKTIYSELGVPVSYHRVSSVSAITNGAIQIQVISYLNEKERERQKSGDTEEDPIFSFPTYYQADYVDGMTCSEAYEFLKTLPEFKGATDILEDTDV